VFVSFLPLERVHVIVTDAGVPAEFRKALEARNIQVLVAQIGAGRDD
jgi:DeoR/GlpR family transcriptional regulator of sugar metabolism